MNKQMMTRLGVCCLGILMTSFSAAIFYLVELGSDPYQAFVTALHVQTGLSYGRMITLINIGVAVFLVMFARSYVKAALFLNVLLFGTCVDIYTGWLGGLIHGSLPVWIRVLTGLAGCVVMAVGIYVYLIPKLGASPTEAIGLILAQISGRPYDKVRIATDVFYAAVGLLFGGNVGIVTVMAVVLTGPIVGILSKKKGGLV